MKILQIIVLFLVIALPMAAQEDNEINPRNKKTSKDLPVEPPEIKYFQLNMEALSGLQMETVEYAELDMGIERAKFRKKNLQDLTEKGESPSPMYVLNFFCQKYDLEVESWNYARISNAQVYYSYLLRKSDSR